MNIDNFNYELKKFFKYCKEYAVTKSINCMILEQANTVFFMSLIYNLLL